jgi:hypothetical protein
MRLPWLRFTLRWTMIAVAVMGVASWAFARYQRWTHYDSGWWEAECELWRGEATIYGCGGLRRGDICDIDQDTGLPVVWPGCVTERMKGHNDHVAQYIRWHGLPKNTLRPWKNELFNLARFFDETSQIDVPKHLEAGGPVLVSPDGRNGLRLVEGPVVPGLQWLVITAGGKVLADGTVSIGSGTSELLWGPQGAPFAVVRSITQTGERFEAYDLRTGRHLRDESRDKEQWSRLRALTEALATLRAVD